MAGSAALQPAVAMEDRNQLAADCVVICTCCPCLILQLLLFVFVGLPRKLAKRSRKLVLRRLRKRKKRLRTRRGRREQLPPSHIAAGDGPPDHRLQMEVADVLRGTRRSPMAEAERVLQQLYEEGQLGFGGSWRRRSGGDVESPAHNLVLRGGDGGSDVRTVQVLYR